MSGGAPGIVSEHRALWIPKAGHRPEEYEDAAAGPVEVTGLTRFAVADGATESARAGAWARALAEAACRAPLPEAIGQARQAFGEASGRGASLPWYAEEKAAEGAHATVLALALHPNGRWSAEAIGDCVLFHLRDGALVLAWPLDDPDAFGNRPALVPSRPDVPAPEPETTTGAWQPGDRFLLATDALAAHLLRHGPEAALGLTPEVFEASVAEARAAGMRNDDVTLVEIVLADA